MKPHPHKDILIAIANGLKTDYPVILLDKGLIHSTKEAAIAWANAMIPFNNK